MEPAMEREGIAMNMEQLLNENACLQKENQRLRQALDEMQTENEYLCQAEADARKEIQGLSRIVFNRVHGETESEAETPIKLPYNVRQRVVIFGGHDSWSKAIRPLLKNVRFVDRESMPNADMIKKADVIWIQTNAMGHKHYRKIIDTARAHSKEVRYFVSASAERCAKDVARADMKR